MASKKKKKAAKKAVKKAAKKAAKKASKKTAKKAAERPSAKAAKRSGGERSAADPADSGEQSGKVAEIKAIIDVMLAAGAVEVETDDGQGGRLRVRLKEDQPFAGRAAPAPRIAPQVHELAPALNPAFSAPVPPPEAPADAIDAITSPMVGTFYRSPSPEASTFVEVGDSFEEETTICIIEAMKVMNEIKAESRGRIVEALVENGEPVEYRQPLFRVARD